MISGIVYAIKHPSLEGVRQIPWYAWTAGALGLVIVGGIGYAVLGWGSRAFS